MSGQAVGWVLDHANAKGSELLVMIAIAERADDHGNGAWPSFADLARRTRLTERAVAYLVKRLEERGEISVGHRKGPHGCNTYAIAGMQTFQDDAVQTFQGAREQPPEKNAGRPENSAPGHERAVSSEPSLEPSLEPSRRRDELFEAIAEACGIDLDELTSSARGALNRATKELRDLQASPAEIKARAAAYVKRFESTPTPSALAKHWPALGSALAGLPSRDSRDILDYIAELDAEELHAS